MDTNFIDLEENSDICRICFEPGYNDNKLISPCKCTGSSKFIHEKCLNEWRLSNLPNSDPRIKCMECNYEYTIITILPKANIITRFTYSIFKLTFTYLFFIIFIFLVLTDTICNKNQINYQITKTNNSSNNCYVFILNVILLLIYLYSSCIFFKFLKTKLFTRCFLKISFLLVICFVINYFYPNNVLLSLFGFYIYNVINYKKYVKKIMTDLTQPYEKILEYTENEIN